MNTYGAVAAARRGGGSDAPRQTGHRAYRAQLEAMRVYRLRQGGAVQDGLVPIPSKNQKVSHKVTKDTKGRAEREGTGGP
jgi:hypothetical protein